MPKRVYVSEIGENVTAPHAKNGKKTLIFLARRGPLLAVIDKIDDSLVTSGLAYRTPTDQVVTAWPLSQGLPPLVAGPL